MGYYKIKCYIVTKWWHSFFLKQRALCLITSNEFICYFGVADGSRLNTRDVSYIDCPKLTDKYALRTQEIEN